MEKEQRRFSSADSGGSAGLVALQVGLLVVGIAAFLWLINIIAIGGDWLPNAAEALQPNTWIAILMPILALVFAGELMLFFFRRS